MKKKTKNNRRKKNNSQKTIKRKRYSIKIAKMISKKNYEKLLQKKKKKKKLTKKENEKLNRALFINYCKCIKNIKYSKKYKKGSEYPICISSVYKKRKLIPPKDIIKKCKRYY